MPMVSGNFGKALWPGINAWYGKEYDRHPEEWKQLFDSYTSRKAFEEDVGISSFGLAAIKGEAQPVSFDNEQQGFVSRYAHVEYALGFVISKILVEDDQYDVVGERRSRALAFSMQQTKEIVAANVYNRAFNPAYVGGDGVSMINTAHPNVSGGTFSNRITTLGDLSELTLEQSCIALMQFTNDRGLKINVRPESLIIPVNYIFIAERILNSTLRPGNQGTTAVNDINALNSMGKFRNVVVNHYLTDPDAFFIRTNSPDGLKHFERRADEFTMDNDFDTDNAKYKATSRYSFGWTDPRGIYGSPGV